MSEIIGNKGLRRVSFLKRVHDNAHQAIYGADQLPVTLGRVPFGVFDQGDTEYCTAYASAAAGGFMNQVEMSPAWQVAAEGEIAGAPIIGGTDPHTALATAMKLGFLPSEASGSSSTSWTAYSALQDGMALPYRPGSYYAVTPTYDAIKEALYAGREEHAVVLSFGFWYQEWNQAANTPAANGIMPIGVTQTGRHAYLFIDWTEIDGVEHLVAQLSQGTGFGSGGLCYFSRDVVNAAFANPVLNGIGCYIFRSLADTQTQEIGLYQQAIALLREIVSIMTPKTGSTKFSTKLAELEAELLHARGTLVGMEQTANGAKIYQEAKSLLGTRVAPDNASTDYGILGCAATVNRIVQLALGSPVGGGTSTYQLWQHLQDKSRFTPITQPVAGDIVVSPTGTNKYPTIMPNGHCGIVGQYGILSNSSETGTLQENYTLQSWNNIFATVGGFPVYFFRAN